MARDPRFKIWLILGEFTGFPLFLDISYSHSSLHLLFFFTASYITVRILDKEGNPLEKQKTATITGTLQPEFSESMVFSLPETLIFDTSLLVKFKSPRLFRPKKLIGNFEITPDSEAWRKLLEDNTLKERWFQFYKKAPV